MTYTPGSDAEVMASMMNALASGTLAAFEREDITALEELLLDDKGYYVNVVSAERLNQFSSTQLRQFCVEHGVYQFITQELVDYLQATMKGTTIEVGSGNGLLASSLGIPATDNMMQRWPDVRLHYQKSKQGLVKYGANVQELEANKAKKKLRPLTIIGCWVTGQVGRSGNPLNMYGIDFRKLARKLGNFVLVGNYKVHHDCQLFSKPCWEVEAPWLVSRGSAPELNRIWVWGDEPPAILGVTVKRVQR